MGKLLGTRNGSPYPLVTRGKRTLLSERHEECAALGGLTHEHGSDAEAHDEEAAEAVEQIHAALELSAVRIDDGDGDDADEAIEGVKRWEHCLVAVHHDDAQDDLNKHGGFSNAGVPPQCAGT